MRLILLVFISIWISSCVKNSFKFDMFRPYKMTLSNIVTNGFSRVYGVDEVSYSNTVKDSTITYFFDEKKLTAQYWDVKIDEIDQEYISSMFSKYGCAVQDSIKLETPFRVNNYKNNAFLVSKIEKDEQGFTLRVMFHFPL